MAFLDHMEKFHDLKRNFFNTAVADIYRAIDGSSLVGAFVLSFCLIDYMTWIEFGEKKGGFNDWIRKRLLPLNVSYLAKDHELYSVRNGLVHSYGPSRAILTRKFGGYQLFACSPSSHLQKVNNDVLKICLYSLLTEIVFAVHQTFEDLGKAANLTQLDRMQRQIIIFGTQPPELFGQMHRALSVFDQDGVVKLRDVQADYAAKILNR
jgi:hypothetical protein